MKPATQPAQAAAAAPPGGARPWRDRARATATLAVWIYLAAGLSATLLARNLGLEDWYLYALMSLCTAIVVANYARLGLRRTWIRRASAMLFSAVVVLGWMALLYEKTAIGWTVKQDRVIELGAQRWFFLPVGLGLTTVALLCAHLFVLMPRARKEAGC